MSQDDQGDDGQTAEVDVALVTAGQRAQLAEQIREAPLEYVMLLRWLMRSGAALIEEAPQVAVSIQHTPPEPWSAYRWKVLTRLLVSYAPEAWRTSRDAQLIAGFGQVIAETFGPPTEIPAPPEEPEDPG